jgi:hypothetical protein
MHISEREYPILGLLVDYPDIVRFLLFSRKQAICLRDFYAIEYPIDIYKCNINISPSYSF